MADDEIFCENCGHKRGSRISSPPLFESGEIVRSTRILTSQQVLLAAISLVGGGILIMMMSAFIPDDPFFDSTRGMSIMMGLASIGIGVAIFVLGNRNIDRLR